jgi:hypothetical protein
MSVSIPYILLMKETRIIKANNITGDENDASNY